MALWPSFAFAQFTYSCVTFFAVVHERSKRLARLCEVCMWLNGYFTLSAAVLFVVCRLSSPLSASAVVGRRLSSPSASAHRRLSHPSPARHSRSSLPPSSVTLLYCIHRAEDIVKHLPRLVSPTIPLFYPECRYPIPSKPLQRRSKSF